jgi:chitodextrinase
MNHLSIGFVCILCIHGLLIGGLGAQTPIELNNPGFEEGTSGWDNTNIGNYEYFAPVDGEHYATRAAGEDYTIQHTGQVIEAGKNYTLTVWARSIFDDDYVDCLLNCRVRDIPHGNPSAVTADVGFVFDSTTISIVTQDVNPRALIGDVETRPNDDGGNIWADFEAGYRHAFADNHFNQPINSDPILDPWFITDDNRDYRRASSGAVAPIIFDDKKWILGSSGCNPFCCDPAPNCKAALMFKPKSGGDPDYIWGDEDDMTYIVWHNGDETPWLADVHGSYDQEEGRLWMILGGSTYHVCELDTATGFVKGHTEPVHYDEHMEDFPQVANWNGDEWTLDNRWKEGAALYKHNGYWYCLGSYGALEISYSIRMGRGTNPTGPFYDKEGIDMNAYDDDENEYGNSFLLADDADHLNPGHPHIWEENGMFYLGYDYSTGFVTSREGDRLGIRPLYWVDDWPTIWTPVTLSFNADDHPAAIGKNLGVMFKNSGEESSVLAIDHISLIESVGSVPDSIDTEAPSTPGIPVKSAFTATSIQVSWDPSDDNRGVAAYRLYMDHYLAANTNDTMFLISGLEPETSYSFYVLAYDSSGYTSPPSPVVHIMTDTLESVPPSIPQGLSSSEIDGVSFKLSWDASSDNIGISGYDVNIDGSMYKTTKYTSTRVDDLSPGTEYDCKVRARDEAGNTSDWSEVLTVKTWVTGIKQSEINEGKCEIYPNPVRSELIINGAVREHMYKIYSSKGDQVMEGMGNMVEVAGLSPGLYYILTGNGRAMKFIKE